MHDKHGESYRSTFRQDQVLLKFRLQQIEEFGGFSLFWREGCEVRNQWWSIAKFKDCDLLLLAELIWMPLFIYEVLEHTKSLANVGVWIIRPGGDNIVLSILDTFVIENFPHPTLLLSLNLALQLPIIAVKGKLFAARSYGIRYLANVVADNNESRIWRGHCIAPQRLQCFRSISACFIDNNGPLRLAEEGRIKGADLRFLQFLQRRVVGCIDPNDVEVHQTDQKFDGLSLP